MDSEEIERRAAAIRVIKPVPHIDNSEEEKRAFKAQMDNIYKEKLKLGWKKRRITRYMLATYNVKYV